MAGRMAAAVGLIGTSLAALDASVWRPLDSKQKVVGVAFGNLGGIIGGDGVGIVGIDVLNR